MQYLFETTVYLDRPKAVSHWECTATTGDHLAHRIRVRTVMGGKTVSPQGCSVYLLAQRQDGACVLCPGQADAEWAWGDLDRACYAVPGDLTVTMWIVQGDGGCLSAARVHLLIRPGTGLGPIIDAADAVPSLSELLWEIAEMKALGIGVREAAEKAEAVLVQARDGEAARLAQEAAREAAEQERAEREADRERAEAARALAEEARTRQEAARTGAEAERVLAEQERREQESARAGAEEARRLAEAERTRAESERAQREAQRAAEEKKRSEEEAERAQAEQQRALSETERTGAEAERDEAERQRADAEAARIHGEKARTEAEAERAKGEAVRCRAETARQDLEAERAAAEAARVRAEAVRQASEAEREEQEAARAGAEAERLEAERARTERFHSALEEAEAATARTKEAARACESWDSARARAVMTDEGSEARIEHTLEEGTRTLTFFLPRGRTGPMPDLSVGTVTTLPPEAEARVTLSGTREMPVLSFALPRGRPGEGHVKTVNGQWPDEDGNIQLQACEAVSGQELLSILTLP